MMADFSKVLESALMVLMLASSGMCQSLYFASNLSEIIAYSGGTVYIECVLEGDSSREGSFNWTGPAVDSMHSHASVYLDESGNKSTLIIYDTSMNDEGRYSCSYTDVGTVFVTLDVISVCLIRAIVQWGTVVLQPCEITLPVQLPDVHFQWSKDGEPVVPYGRFQINQNGSLTINFLLLSDSGLYQVNISNTHGSALYIVRLSVLTYTSGVIIRFRLELIRGSCQDLQRRNEMFLEELKQVTCNSLDICTDPELFIDFSEHTFLCYGSKYGSYSVITSSGPITAKIIERPRDFSISLDNGTILTFLALCESNQECPISTSNDSQISTSNDSQISTSNDSQIYIALSVIIIIVVITVTTTVLLALILARYKCRRKNFIRPYDNSTKLKQTTNHQSAIKQNSSDIALTEIEITDSCADNHFNNTVTAYTVQSSHRTSIPDHLIFSAASIQLTDSIGQGEFGIVYKGYIINSRQIIMDIVAIKTLKGFQDHSTVEKLLIECTKMKDLNHPNVLTLIGVCLDGGPAPFIITPFMENGSLLSYLRKKRSILLPREVNVKPVLKQLMDMCLQVAKGMEYLASMKIVHRDLAARNCMMDINSVIKVADFGLAETLGNKDYFRQDKTIIIKLPLRWLAPESLEDHIFSEKSDVWAYGVTCWEIFSGGKVLYPGVNESELLWLFKSGQRLDKPENCACSDHMYSFMSQCWELEPQKRPPFSELVQSLSVTLETMAEYVPLCKETSKESEV